jgi:hypothetical protein
MKPKKMLIVSDLHCGHRSGLTPPAFNHSVDNDAPHHLKKQYRMRRELWRWFASAVNMIGEVDYLLINGDCIEGKGAKSGGTELITSDRNEQVAITVKAVSMIKVKSKIFMTYGTPRHVGEEEDFEDTVAKGLEAAKIEGEGHYDLNGLQIAAKHYIGNSSSPISSMTALRGAQIKQLLWATHKQQPQANLIIRSHIHRCYGVSEPALNFQGWVTPALQGLGSKYGIRQCDGLPVDFGMILVKVDNPNSWNVTPIIAPKALEASEVLKL